MNSLTFRKDGNRYQVHVGSTKQGVLLGFVERFSSRNLTEWTAYDTDGHKVGTVGTRGGAARLLTLGR